jgi:hypothetical protein
VETFETDTPSTPKTRDRELENEYKTKWYSALAPQMPTERLCIDIHGIGVWVFPAVASLSVLQGMGASPTDPIFLHLCHRPRTGFGPYINYYLYFLPVLKHNTFFDTRHPNMNQKKENIGMEIAGDSGSNHLVIRDVWFTEGTNRFDINV